jgi:hypothetical protein
MNSIENHDGTPPVQADLVKLVPLALEALQRMFIRDQELFCYREKRLGNRLLPEGLSVRYTAITLIGLLSAQQHGVSIPFDLERLAQRLYSATESGLGDLGLISWGLSLQWPILAQQIAETLKYKIHANTLAVLNPMELSWLLIGLCMLYRSGVSRDETLAHDTAHVLLSTHEARTGLFYRTTPGVRSIIRPLASFAMHIYPIYALATYAETFQRMTLLAPAQACADRLCALQLSDGGWPWMYDVRTGTVVDPYPVYSVHQDGMAPMALLKLTQVGGYDFSAAIERGIRWLQQNNALKASMIDEKWRTIWRAQEVPRVFGLQARLMVNGLSALLLKRAGITIGPMEIVAECRPYHLGWLLHAVYIGV